MLVVGNPRIIRSLDVLPRVEEREKTDLER
jgi:hypothetical protein